MNKEQKENILDLVALLSMAVFVVGVGVAAILFSGKCISPLFIKDYSPDKILQGSEAIFAIISIFIFLIVGSFIGGTLWVFCMGHILPYDLIKKWLTYGPQIKWINKINFKILHFVNKRHL